MYIYMYVCMCVCMRKSVRVWECKCTGKCVRMHVCYSPALTALPCAQGRTRSALYSVAARWYPPSSSTCATDREQRTRRTNNIRINLNWIDLNCIKLTWLHLNWFDLDSVLQIFPMNLPLSCYHSHPWLECLENGWSNTGYGQIKTSQKEPLSFRLNYSICQPCLYYSMLLSS